MHNQNTVRNIIAGVTILLLVLGILRIGIAIGYYKAKFSENFSNNFERNFMGPRGMMPGSHGAVGEILNINLPEVVITGPDKLEKTLIVSTSTVIRRFREDLKAIDLKINDHVIILGNPNEKGQIEAKLIRIMSK